MSFETFLYCHTAIAIGIGWIIGLVTGITLTLKGVFNTNNEKGIK